MGVGRFTNIYREIAIFAMLSGIFTGVAADAEEDVFYQSSLADAAALLKPAVGPAAVPGKDGKPSFRQGAAGPGMISRGAGGPGYNATGSYVFPAARWPSERGTITFWFGLPDDWPSVPAMPIVMGELGRCNVQFDLRTESKLLNFRLGEGGGTADISHWKAGEKHHVAFSWDIATQRVNLYLDGMFVSRGLYTKPITLTNFHMGSFGQAQANYAAVVSDLRIVRTARAEFPEVPEKLRKAQGAHVVQAVRFSPSSETSLLNSVWKLEGAADAGEVLNDIGGDALSLRIWICPKEGLLLRPATSLPLSPTTMRILVDMAAIGLGKTTVSFLMRGDDGAESEILSRQITGSVWSQVVSDYAGGERRELNSMRPDLSHPRGKSLPSELIGIRVKPQRAGMLYLRNLVASEIEYLKHRRWELVTPHATPGFGMHPFGPAQPEVRLDWFLPEKPGTYKVQWSVADVFQGPSIDSGEWTGDWNPANLDDAYKKKFSFNLPGAGTYWLTLKIWDGTGSLVNLINLPMGVVRDKPHVPAAVVWAKYPRLTKSLGFVNIDTGVENHIFATPDMARIRVRIDDPKIASSYILKYTVRDTAFTRILEIPKIIERQWIPSQTETFDIPLELNAPGAFDVSVELLANERVADRAILRVGVSAPVTPEKITIRQPTLSTTFGPGKLVSMNGDNANWYTTHAKTTLSFTEQYRQNIAEWQRMHTTEVRLRVGAEELLPLPGLVDLRTVEERVRLLREAGMPYLLDLGTPHFRFEPGWAAFAMQEDMFGLPYVGLDQWTSAYFMDPSSPAVVEMLQTMIRALYARYGNDPSFRGWIFWTDILFVDQGNRRTGYSPSMQDGFIPWLRKEKGIASIEELNARYGIQLGKWDEADIPLPPVRYWKEYAGSPVRTEHQSYKDYWDYRLWQIKHLHHDGMVRFARSLGDTRPFGFYSYSCGQEIEYHLPELISLGCFTTLGNEGFPGYNFIRNGTLSPFYGGHAYLAEYQSYVPGKKEMNEKDCDRILSTVMLTGGRNLNIMTFLNPSAHYRPNEAKSNIVKKGIDRQRLWMEALPAFAKTEIYPWEIGCYNFGESAGGAIAQYLWPAYPNHLLKSFMPDAALAEQKIIFVPAVDGGIHNADFTPSMQEQLVRYVQQGGKLILVSPDSARYTRDNPNEQFALLAKLGWKDLPALLIEKKDIVEAAAVNGGKFKRTKQLKLAGSVPPDVRLPDGATAEASFSNGQPAVVRWPVGKGEVLLFVRECDFAKQVGTALIDDLLEWAGVHQRVKAKGLFFTYAHDGDIRYLMLYKEGPPCEKKQYAVSVMDLPQGSYKVMNIGPDPLDLGVLSADEWRAGKEIPMSNGMLVLRFQPVK